MNSIVFVSRALRQDVRNKLIQSQRIASFSSKEAEEPAVPQNVIKDLHTASEQPENGIVYDKKPFKIKIEAGKRYAWCLCGRSKNQPFCDGTHRSIFLKIKLRPIIFVVEETKDYWLCNCKQTLNRPFCDGAHKKLDGPETAKR